MFFFYYMIYLMVLQAFSVIYLPSQCPFNLYPGGQTCECVL